MCCYCPHKLVQIKSCTFCFSAFPTLPHHSLTEGLLNATPPPALSLKQQFPKSWSSKQMASWRLITNTLWHRAVRGMKNIGTQVDECHVLTGPFKGRYFSFTFLFLFLCCCCCCCCCCWREWVVRGHKSVQSKKYESYLSKVPEEDTLT